MSEPRYDARTVEAPDGTRITVAYKPGTRVDHMTDEEFLATFHPDKMRRTVTVHEPDTVTAVTDLAEERLLRHPCGAPYTADEIAPFLADLEVRGEAERIANLINRIIDARLHGGGRHA